MSLYNDNFLDALAVVSFMVGIANYDENLSQSDKDDMMQSLNQQMTGLLQRLEEDLEVQNGMLRQILLTQQEILDRLGEIES